jgi:hypothetical protein
MDSGAVHIATLADPLLRLLLGSDAFRFVQEHDLAKLESENRRRLRLNAQRSWLGSRLVGNDLLFSKVKKDSTQKRFPQTPL